MPIQSTETFKTRNDTGNKSSYLIPFMLVTSLFFLWGLANSLNGTLIKHFQTALNLNRAQAGIVDSAFYVGYFVMALPAAFLMNRIGYKRGILIGLLLYAAGAFIFFPAAELRVYGVFLFALFVIACGLAFLETAANPYVTVLGDPKSADMRINLSQSFNGLSTVFAPIIGSMLIFSKTEYTNEILNAMPPAEADAIRMAEAHAVQLPYLLIGGLVLFIAVLFAVTKMPEISSTSEKEASFSGITRHRHLMFGIIAQFFYVGGQTAIFGYFVDMKLHFAKDMHLPLVMWLYPVESTMTPAQIAGFHASFALILFMAGRFVGSWLMTKVKAHILLALYAAICIALSVYGWLGSGASAIIAIGLTYFFMSIMFPTIFSLSIRNLGDQVKLGSGLVIMAIVGGAVLPPLAGLLSLGNVQNAMIVPAVSFVVILLFGLWGYKVKTTH